jgi:hypothetical protein
MIKRSLGLAFVAALAGWMAAGGGCASGGRAAADLDPMAEIRNEKAGEPRRREAIRRVWAQVEAEQLDRMAVREDLKGIAWSPAWPVSLRLAALEAVTSDRTEAGQSDTRNMVRLMIPRESEMQVTAFLSRMAGERGWTETTPALVRSLARPRWETPDQQRPEYAAIEALNRGRTVDQVAFDIFLSPPEADVRGVVTPERVRGDAWDLLARLDADGSRRAALIMTDEPGAPTADVVAEMRILLREMRTLPLTGEEIRWLGALRDFSDPVRRTWWASTSSIIQRLDQEQTGRLQMRHLEPVRWASEHRPEWIAASREALLEELRGRLQGRQFHRRQAHRAEMRPPPDRLSDWERTLSWGDLISILVIDEALKQPQVVSAFFEQADQDQRDKSAEYGGLLRARASAGGDRLGGPTFAAVLYPPRTGNRRGDHEFVAPTDMIDQSYHALAHYHFHVQEIRNHEYAGPSPGDLAYAARFGRSCLVLTGVGTGALNADYYQPDGVVLDLGTLRR